MFPLKWEKKLVHTIPKFIIHDAKMIKVFDSKVKATEEMHKSEIKQWEPTHGIAQLQSHKNKSTIFSHMT